MKISNDITFPFSVERGHLEADLKSHQSWNMCSTVILEGNITLLVYIWVYKIVSNYIFVYISLTCLITLLFNIVKMFSYCK